MTVSVTVKDVAQAAAVSVVTVSRVFNNHANVKEEMRQRVLKAAAELGYSNPKSQVGRRSGAQGMKEIGFFFWGGKPTADLFWAHIMTGAESEARNAGIKLSYRSIGDLTQHSEQLQTTVHEMGIDGILLVCSPDPGLIRFVQETRLPVVLVDTDVPGLAVNAVLSDYFGGAKQAVEYLIQRGHRDIAFIGLPPSGDIYTAGLRRAGYRIALLDAGIPLNDELDVPSNLDPESAYDACRVLLARNTRFSAIFCMNDLIAVGVLKALHEAGLRVPEDISVIGLDDIDLARHLTPALTTIRVNKEEMGAIAVKQLLASATQPEVAAVTTLLKVELIVRDSVASRIP